MTYIQDKADLRGKEHVKNLCVSNRVVNPFVFLLQQL